MTILSNIAGWASNPTACCGCVLTVLGALAAARIGWEVLSYVWLHFLRPKTDLKIYGAKKGAWAVVTGCTNGIGEGFSHVLAQRGFNVVLVSRNEALLKPLAAGISGKYGVKAEVIAVDCANASDADYARLNASLKAVGPLAVVVNNVGVNRTETPNEFAAMTEEELEQMLEVNVRFHSKFTKLCIPLLQQRNATAAGEVAKRGAILHLSSFSGVFPAGLMSVYSATKSYADAFGRALHSELAGRKNGSIDSASVVAHYVVSNMSGFDRPSMGVPTAVDFAKATLNKLGTVAQLVPHWHHDLMARIIRALPQSFVASKGYGMMQAVRKALTDPKKMEKRAARKAAAEAKKAEERKKFADAAAAGGKKDA